MTERDVYVDGAWSRGGGAPVVSSCPATGETVWSGQGADRGQVTEAVAAARRAFPAWSGLPQSERTSLIEAYGEALSARSEEIAETIARDMGKALWDARGEAGAMVAKIALSTAAQAERAGSAMKPAAVAIDSWSSSWVVAPSNRPPMVRIATRLASTFGSPLQQRPTAFTILFKSASS